MKKKSMNRKTKQKLIQGLAVMSVALLSTSAQAATTPAFLTNIMSVWCTITSASGPLVPMLAGTAIIVFAVAMMFMEEKGGLISALIKIVMAIGIIVGVGAILGWFGIGLNCADAGSSLNIQL